MNQKELHHRMAEISAKQKVRSEPGLSAYAKLRTDTLLKQKRLLRDRQRSDKPISDIELALGVYIEEIEPQFQMAAERLVNAGIPIRQSGFNELDPKTQMLVLNGLITDDKTEQLRGINVTVISTTAGQLMHGLDDDRLDDPMTMIEFTPGTLNLDSIKEQWNTITDILVQTPGNQ
jgi:hypothetical protein